ncbi:hypothetical protein C3941_06725 [Kaistia algarum]|uniref:acyltransferase family protein n=1 Tax=Kaistia algarum TaxID=2083279 RepID=UPI000CE7AA07|nr:acyltransferase family protein [Kaistia algarum]MCX5515631.1 acyltransferase family protein [Kaistia algarum]PPE80980.1 hypothetical protein C3941_06725 [Kaistia algarum]
MLLVSDSARGRPGRSSAQTSDAYKPHIDGLRAISIIAVLGYHGAISGFGGGFVGVDIFFVISGFLIINQITASLSAQRFSIWDFYARRALRILPPYYLVLIVTFLIALLLLRSPRELDDFRRAALLAPIFLTNVHFFLKSGYFDLDSHEKPLLHTWSLAVEEQFYLLAPLILMAAFYFARRGRFKDSRVVFATALVIGVASFIGCILFTLPGRNPAFYLPMWRAWEFVAGGAVGALATLRFGRWNDAVGTLTGLVGLTLIVSSVTLFGEVTAFPGSAAAIPVLGAVLVLFSGLAAPSAPVAVVLSTVPFRFVGRISYALYLWHWPFLVFGRFLPFEVSDTVVVTVALSLSFIFAVATHYAIERPIVDWRRKSAFAREPRLQRKVVYVAVGASILGAVAMGSVSWFAFWAVKQNPMLAAVEMANVKGSGACLDPTGDAEKSCLDGTKPLGFIVGDSHALAIQGRVEYEAEQDGDRLLSLVIAGCNPVVFVTNPTFGATNSVCAPLFKKFEHFTGEMGAEPQFAVVAGIWNVVIENAAPTDEGAETRFRDGMAKLLSILAEGGQRRVLLVGPVPELHLKDPYNCIALKRSFGLSVESCGVPRAEVEARRKRTVTIMKALAAEHPNVRFIDPVDVFCDAKLCLPLKDGAIAYMDSNHLNPYGAKILFNRFRSDFLWAFKGDGAKS